MESNESNINNNQNQENITVAEEVKDWTDIHEDFKYCQQEWEQANFTYEQTKLWIEVGFKPEDLDEVKQWINCEFSPTEAKTWLDKGLKTDEAHFAAQLRNNNQVITDKLEQLRNDYWKLAMNNSQTWLEQVYPNQNVKELYINKAGNSDKLTGELNLSNYSQLEKLDCSYNNLTTITYPEQLAYLTELYISWNEFPKQEPTFLTKMPNLEVFDIGGKNNHFTNLEAYLKYCPKLKKLDAGSSNLTDSLTIQDLPALEETKFMHNNLTNLQLLNCPNLTRIDCSSNKLTNLKLTNLPKVTKLYVSSNLLNQTLDCFTPLVNLEELDLSNTNFRGSLTPLGANSKLKKLSISRTNLNSDIENLPVSLEKIYSDGMTEIENKLEGFGSYGNYNYQLWRLGWEWLQDNNKLSSEQKQKITTLNISNRKLIGPLDFSEFPNLEKLYCSNNEITNLELSKCSKLKELDCSNNHLTYLNLNQNINLTQLDCRNCQLASLNVDNCSNLAELKCQNNKLVNLNLSQNLVLTTLLANDNNLIEIEFPTDLNQFNLTRINITNNKDLNYLTIDKKFLKILPKLESKKAIKKLTSEEWNQVIKQVKKDIEGEIQAPIYFSTWWNPNCALIVNKAIVKYAIRLVIYEPAIEISYREEIPAILKIIRFPSSSNHLVGYKSMDRVQEKIAWLKEKLNSDNPIYALEDNDFSPTEIMEIRKIDNPNSLNPTDLVWRNMKGLLGTYHVAVYLGNKKVAHIGSSKFVKSIGFNPSNPSGEKALLGARVDHWDDFQLTADKIFAYHPIIPFKRPELIQEHLTQAVLAEYGQAEYNLFGNNCEHFATMIVCGVPFSTQSDKIKMLIKDWNLEKEIAKSNKKFEEMTKSDIFKSNLEKNKERLTEKIKTICDKLPEDIQDQADELLEIIRKVMEGNNSELIKKQLQGIKRMLNLELYAQEEGSITHQIVSELVDLENQLEKLLQQKETKAQIEQSPK